MKKQSGFSLIELLVVVAIIGFLSAIGMAVYADVQAKGRDTKRKADIDSIAKVLEVHRTDSNGYSPLLSTWFGSSAGIPVIDPKGWHYCLAAKTSGTINDADSTNWVATGTNKGDCTGGDYATGNISLDASKNASVPVSGTTTWKVCTLLEQAVNGSLIYCRYSVQ